MEQILDRLVQRPGLEQAQMAGAAIRNVMNADRERAMATLKAWSEHPNEYVRIASGHGYATVAIRDREALGDVLPYLERLSNDAVAEVREYGAQGALEQIWMAHTDAMWGVVDHWIEARNENVKEVVVRTIARIVTSGQIRRPSVLRRFIELGLKLFDRALPSAGAALRRAMAEALDEMGCMAPELISPFIVEWARRTDEGSLRLVVEVTKLPFGGLCHGLDVEDVRSRLRGITGNAKKQYAQWARQGAGRVESPPVLTNDFVLPEARANRPWAHWADPYRGCELRCEFCNSRSMKEWSGESRDSFVRSITRVQNAPEVLEQELTCGKLEPRDRHVLGIGIGSDPYQPAEEKYELTRSMLKFCLQYEHPVIIQTRQSLVLRDVDILERLADKGLVNVLVAMQTSVEGIRSKLEIGTATVAERYRTIRMLCKARVPVGLLLSPIMPKLTDEPGLMEETLRRAADAGASWVVPEILTLEGSARVKVKLFLDEVITTLVDDYKTIYGASEDGRHADPQYAQRICGELIPELAVKFGLTDTSRMLTSGKDPERILSRG